MTVLSQLAAVTAVLLGALAAIAIWAPRRLAVKLAALALAVLSAPVCYAALAGLLSLPKPAALEWWQRSAPEATLLASVFREGVGIDVWVQLPGSVLPRAYTLPWDTAIAEQIQAAREAAGEDGQVILRLPFERSWDDKEPKVYALPQPAAPPKDYTDPPAQQYQRPGEDA